MNMIIANTFGLKQRGTDKIVASELCYNNLVSKFKEIGNTLASGIYDVVVYDVYDNYTQQENISDKYFVVL